MSLTFYYSPMSTASVVHLVLEELGVPYEKVRVDLKAGDTKKAEFLKLNPNGKVPVLVHDGVAIFESCAINIHLGEMFGVDKKLFPAQGTKRAEALKWMVWANASLVEAVVRFSSNTSDMVPAERRNPAAGEAAKADVGKLLQILDHALEGKAYLLGDFSIADSHVSGFMGWLQFMKFDLAPYKALSAWNARCMARPAFARAMAG